MITINKSTTKVINSHLTCGTLLSDKRIEIFADKETHKVYFKQYGQTFRFVDLPTKYKELYMFKLFKDDEATKQLHKKYSSLDEMLEHFAFCLHGDADIHPDIVDGNITEAENFRCKPGLECECLKWQSKNITIDGKKLTRYQLELTLALATGKPDKVICLEMANPITQSTLDTRKRLLYKFANVHCKAEFVAKAINQKVIQ